MAKKTKKIIVANWKMNPGTLHEAEEIFMGIKKETKGADAKVVICPPFVYMNELKRLFMKDRLSLGAQNVSHEAKGAFTGEISTEMLQTVGADYVIIGHSERRAMGESDELIAKKTAAALRAGLSVILCVGEKERDEQGAYLGLLKKQMSESLAGVPKRYAENLIVAYEPIWAIGKGNEAIDAHGLHQMTIFIRKHLIDIYKGVAASSVRIIYGGSVNPDNAGAMVHEGEVDGLLVGRESLSPERFGLIVKASAKK